MTSPAARPNPQRSARCTHPHPGRTELPGTALRSPGAWDATTTPDFPPVFPRGRGSRALTRRPALAATRPRPGLSRVPGAAGISGHGAAGLGNPPNRPAGPDTSGSRGRIPPGMHRGQMG